jgi:DNA-binding response OmpR family regulator
MTSRHTILYAEDDPDDLFMVSKAFEAHDHIKVVHAENGWDAIRKLEDMLGSGVKPCLIILDINMPVLNGKEALIRIRSNDEFDEVPIVMFSTSSSELDKIFAAQWKSELFTKPLQFKDLEAIAGMFVDKCNFEVNKLRS